MGNTSRFFEGWERILLFFSFPNKSNAGRIRCDFLGGVRGEWKGSGGFIVQGLDFRVYGLGLRPLLRGALASSQVGR